MFISDNISTKESFIDISILWKYREFDRIKKPAPHLPFHGKQYTIDEHIKYILDGNKVDAIDLVILNNKSALIVEGNHRIASYKLIHGFNYKIKTRILFCNNLSELGLREHLKERFKEIDNTLLNYL